MQFAMRDAMDFEEPAWRRSSTGMQSGTSVPAGSRHCAPDVGRASAHPSRGLNGHPDSKRDMAAQRRDRIRPHVAGSRTATSSGPAARRGFDPSQVSGTVDGAEAASPPVGLLAPRRNSGASASVSVPLCESSGDAPAVDQPSRTDASRFSRFFDMETDARRDLELAPRVQRQSRHPGSHSGSSGDLVIGSVPSQQPRWTSSHINSEYTPPTRPLGRAVEEPRPKTVSRASRQSRHEHSALDRPEVVRVEESSGPARTRLRHEHTVDREAQEPESRHGASRSRASDEHTDRRGEITPRGLDEGRPGASRVSGLRHEQGTSQPGRRFHEVSTSPAEASRSHHGILRQSHRGPSEGRPPPERTGSNKRLEEVSQVNSEVRQSSTRHGHSHSSSGRTPPPVPRVERSSRRCFTAPESQVAQQQRQEAPQLDQAEKDARLAELLQQMTVRGCRDSEFTRASDILEQLDWDVEAACAHFRVPRAANVLSEMEHLQLQQAEWDNEFEVEEASLRETAQQQLLARAREEAVIRRTIGNLMQQAPRSIHATRERSTHLMTEDEGSVPTILRRPTLAAAVPRRRHSYPSRGEPGTVSSEESEDDEDVEEDQDDMDLEELDDDDDVLEERDHRAHRLSTMAASMAVRSHGPGRVLRVSRGTPGVNGRRHVSSHSTGHPQDEEEFSIQVLLGALMRTQDEADYQDALRRSAEEAYSGGFSVPPADEDAVARTSATSIFCGGQPGQCAVCLSDFAAGDSLRTLQCAHRFHMACVDQWLSHSGQCPVCKHRVGC